ncbi:MAG: metalloregulator ArsR/SmtB family transcription factor [Daejeonella sp.]
MAINKKEEFTSEDQLLAEFAKALAHPARIAILKVLAEKKTCICGEIVEILPLAQSTVSQHLKELKNAGLIKGSISGPSSCYCLNQEAFNNFENAITNIFSQVSNSTTECC